MSGSSGIGGGASPVEKPSGGEPVQDGGPGNIGDIAHAQISTLADLKNLLIQQLGEKEGTKFYNQFMMSVAMLMIQQVQHSADQAKKASQEMRMDSH